MVALNRSERGHAILTHILHSFWFSVIMALIFGALLFIVTSRRDLWLRCTAAETRFWERLGFRPGRLSRAMRRFAEGSAYRYVLWFLVVGFVVLILLNAAMYWYLKYRLDHITI
jgi:hypothetical protein